MMMDLGEDHRPPFAGYRHLVDVAVTCQPERLTAVEAQRAVMEAKRSIEQHIRGPIIAYRVTVEAWEGI